MKTSIRPEFDRAIAAHKSGDLPAAIRQYQCILEERPSHADGRHLLGVAVHQQGDHASAVAHIRRALELCPDNAGFICNLGTVLQALGNIAAACGEFQRGVELAPDSAEMHFNYGNCLKQNGETGAAIAAYERALQLRPNYPQAQNNLGNAFVDQGRLDEALRCFRSALKHQPAFADAHHNLANTLVRQERHHDAKPHFAAAALHAPQRAEFLQSYFLSLSYDTGVDDQQRFELHRLWGRQVEALCRTAADFTSPADPGRRLNIGYVSADFREHAVADFIEPVLRSHDRTQFHVTCYANVSHPDQRTKRLRGYADRWRSIPGLSDADAARMIYEDDIDILVDLAGHTAGHRLGVFARNSAPIQVTGVGYGWTTGLRSMHYRLTDAIADPPGEPRRHTEQLVRLPQGIFCFQPPETAPDVSELPAAHRGAITFGGFHRHVKLNAPLLRLWAQILERVPSSRLLLKDRAFRHRHVVDRCLEMCAASGIGRDRVSCIDGADSRYEHLAAYGQVDVALDAWPYGGSTTTCEALWMGVPVVTLAGDSYVGRMSAGILTQAGLPELIASTEEEYVAIAVRVAHDIAALQQVRGRLRDVLGASVLCDRLSYTRQLEAGYRQMWRNWCAGRDKVRRAS